MAAAAAAAAALSFAITTRKNQFNSQRRRRRRRQRKGAAWSRRRTTRLRLNVSDVLITSHLITHSANARACPLQNDLHATPQALRKLHVINGRVSCQESGQMLLCAHKCTYVLYMYVACRSSCTRSCYDLKCEHAEAHRQHTHISTEKHVMQAGSGCAHDLMTIIKIIM